MIDKNSQSSEGKKDGNKRFQLTIKEGWKHSRYEDIARVVMAGHMNKAVNEKTPYL